MAADRSSATPSRPDPPAFAGAVLCGGASRRMGTDKALVEIDGTPMAVRVARALAAAGARRVIAVGGDARALAAAGLEVVSDLEPGAGPLGGVVTALGALTGADGDADTDADAGPGVVFVASCDLVQPSAAAMARTVGALGDAPDAAVAVPLVGGRRQWMHAAWRAGAAPTLGSAFAAGERAIHAACAVGGLPVLEVDLPATAVADADAPADLPSSGSV
jgi:molybdenum cofactor guanylyltransferase